MLFHSNRPLRVGCVLLCAFPTPAARYSANAPLNSLRHLLGDPDRKRQARVHLRDPSRAGAVARANTNTHRHTHARNPVDLQEESRLGELQKLQQQRELERLVKKEEEERKKKEQDAILNRAGNARPKLAFGIKPNTLSR